MNRLWSAVFLALLLILSTSNVYSQSQKGASFPLVVMVVAPNDFTDQEYFETRRIFDQAKAKVTVASIEKGVALSHDGARIKVDAAIRELVPNQFEAIVIIGGLGAIDSLSKSESLRALLIEAYRQHKVVAAICVAPIVLAKAGLLRNKQATCYSAGPIIDELKRNGAIYKNEEVLRAERIITANGPEASAAFGRMVLEELASSGEEP